MGDLGPGENDVPWVIMKRGLFYRPGAMGYTGIRDLAGHFSEAEAKDYAEGDGVSCMPLAEAPEYSVACFPDLRERHMFGKLTAAIAARDEEIARLREALTECQEALAPFADAADKMAAAAGVVEIILDDGTVLDPSGPVRAAVKAKHAHQHADTALKGRQL